MKDKIKSFLPIIILVVVGLLLVVLSLPSHASEYRSVDGSFDIDAYERENPPVRLDTTSWPYLQDDSVYNPSYTPTPLSSLVQWNDFASANGRKQVFITSSSDNYSVKYSPTSNGWNIPHLYTSGHYNTIRIYMPDIWLDMFSFRYYYTYSNSDFAISSNNVSTGSGLYDGVQYSYIQINLDGSSVGDLWYLTGVSAQDIYEQIAPNLNKTVHITYKYRDYTDGNREYLLGALSLTVPMDRTSLRTPTYNYSLTVNNQNYTKWFVLDNYVTLSLDPSEEYENFTVFEQPMQIYLYSDPWFNSVMASEYQRGRDSVLPTSTSDLSFTNMIYAIVTSPIAFLASAFEFEVFGIQIVPLLFGLMTIALVVFVIKKLKG